MNRSIRRTPLILVGALLLATCAPDTGDGRTSGSTREGPDPGTVADGAVQSSSRSRVALPGLFSIMAGLQADMARISQGLWLENLDSVAVAAEAVANHPRVPPEEFQRISSVLGEEMRRFGGMDARVHDLAVRMSEEARREELDAVLSTDAELRRACVSCHSAFRERLREEIR